MIKLPGSRKGKMPSCRSEVTLKRSTTSMLLITVRQTIDPYADNIQYIASRAVALEPDGRLCLSTIGLGKPGNNFFITSREEHPGKPFSVVSEYMPSSNTLDLAEIRMMASYEDGPYPILTIAESGDRASGRECQLRRIKAREREQRVAHLKGLVTHAWNRLASAFS